MYLKAHPTANADDFKNLYDACDTGKQCTPWSDKNPTKVKDGKVNAYDCWDSNIFSIIDEAASD